MRLGLLLLPVLVAACEPVPMSPQLAADICEEQARAAQGPTTDITIGVNSEDGPFTSAAIGISGDFVAGRDPLEVYDTCVFRRTGQAPIRPPVLREPFLR